MGLKQTPSRLWHEETGQDFSEGTLLRILVALSSIVATIGLIQAISNGCGNAAANLSSAT